jgi:broad specificity phosphatase PhoE
MNTYNKNIYCIRHGKAFHNILFNKIGNIAYSLYQDTPLVHEGYLQADNLSKTWDKINDIDLVLVSPLHRPEFKMKQDN